MVQMDSAIATNRILLQAMLEMGMQTGNATHISQCQHIVMRSISRLLLLLLTSHS
jgi:hypothetical protein